MRYQKYFEVYCNRLGVPMPTVFWTKKDMRDWFHAKYPGRRVTGLNHLGMCYYKVAVIYINLRRHGGSSKHIRHTIAHELIHLKYRIPHGDRFYKLTMALISGRLVPDDRPKIVIKHRPVRKVCKLCKKQIIRVKAHLKRAHPRLRIKRITSQKIEKYFKQ